MNFSSSQWIWSKDIDKNQYVDFLQNFDVQSNQQTVLNISAKSDYTVYVNGIYAASGQYHDYPDYKVYDSIDISNYVKTGNNTLAVIGYTSLKETGSNIVDGSGIIFEVLCGDVLAAVSSKGTLCRQSLDYISGDSYIVKGPIGYGLTYDFKRYDGWTQQGYKPIGFENCLETHGAKKLVARPIKKLFLQDNVYSNLVSQGTFIYKEGETAAEKMQHSYMSYIKKYDITNEREDWSFPRDCGLVFKHDKSEGTYFIIDLHKVSTGHLSFDIELFEDADIDVGFGEHLDDMRVRTSIASNFAYEIKGKCGQNLFKTYFKRLGARYLQFFVHSNHFIVKYAGITAANYPLNIQKYDSQNFIYKKIYEVSLNTLIQCMHEHYEDCPMREQAQYAMDTRTQMLCGYYAFKEYQFPRAALVLMGYYVNQHGNIPITSPTLKDFHIPGFTLVYFLALKEYVEHSGDLSIITQMHDSCEKIINHYLSKIQPNGLIKRQDNGWNFYEWGAGLVNWDKEGVENGETEYPAPLNAFFAIALESYAYLNKKLGKTKIAEELFDKAQQVKKALYLLFWNEENNLFCTYIRDGKQMHYSEYTQVILLYSGLDDEKKKQLLLKKITEDTETQHQFQSYYIHKGEGLQPLSLSNYIYKYDVLLQNGKEYKSYVIEDINKRWGGMLLKGATAFWETEAGGDDFHLAGSECHGWSAIPAYIYQRYGIK